MINPAAFQQGLQVQQNRQATHLTQSSMPAVLAPPTSMIATPTRNSVPQNGGGSNMATPQQNIVIDDHQMRQAANTFPLPPVIRVTVTSAAGVGAVPTMVFLFNQTIYQNITDNGSGAGSITYAWQDNFGGNSLTELAGATRGSVGAMCFGVYIRMIVTSSRAADPVGLGDSAPAWLSYNGYSNSIPNNLDVGANQTRGDFDDSIEVMPCMQNISKWAQFAFIIPPGDDATVVFYTTPNYKK